MAKRLTHTHTENGLSLLLALKFIYPRIGRQCRKVHRGKRFFSRDFSVLIEELGVLELSLHGQSLEMDSLSAALLDRESPMLKWQRESYVKMAKYLSAQVTTLTAATLAF